jgi:L-fuconolactonase
LAQDGAWEFKMSENEINPPDEEILFPGLPICDPHHHFFNSPDFHYWLPDLVLDIKTGHNIVSTVYVDARLGYLQDGPEDLKPVGEIECVDSLVANNRQSAGINIGAAIIGHADLKLGDRVKPVLEAHIAASPDRFRGIRIIACWDSSPACTRDINASQGGLLLDTAFRRGLACLKEYNLSLDVTLFHPQIPELVDLARAFPDTTIILDHTGGPLGAGPYADNPTEVFRNWQKNMAELAGCSNVYVKIGGLAMEIYAYGLTRQPKPINSITLAEIIKPYCLWCIEKFGVNRCMFESNFPIDKQQLAYAVLWNAFKRITKDFSTAERQALFHDAAFKAYRISE